MSGLASLDPPESSRLATPAGLEPATCRLEGGCSIQLSYGAGRALCWSGEFASVLLAYETSAYGTIFRFESGRPGPVNGSIGLDGSS
jgi:hypothetical protein